LAGIDPSFQSGFVVTFVLSSTTYRNYRVITLPFHVQPTRLDQAPKGTVVGNYRWKEARILDYVKGLYGFSNPLILEIGSNQDVKH